MGSYSNPLVGNGWNNQGSWGTMSPTGSSNPIQISGMSPYGTPGISSPAQSAGSTTSMLNPGGFQNPLGPNEINRNIGLTNLQAGQMKNQLAPQWAQLMGQYGQGAGNFFQNLMNLGSPYYGQQQASTFNQGVQQNQNAQNQALQQLRAQGYGSTPSGASAAMLGGMNQAGAQTLSQNYLQNLFNNEQMQLQGAQGLGQMAQLFNPNQLLSGVSAGANIQAQPNFFQDFASIVGSLNGAGGNTASGAGVSL